MGAVYKREVKALLRTVYSWLFAAVLLLATGIVMFRINLLMGYPDMTYNLVEWGEYVLIVMIPLLCMRCVTYDKKHGTDRLYFSLPISTASVVLGKYFALLTVFTIPVGILAVYPLILRSFGEINLLSTYASLLMFFLVGAALFAMCVFLSSLTKYMTVAAILGFVACAALFLLQTIALLIPMSALASFIGFGVMAILLTVVAWFATKSVPATAATAALTVLPLSVIFILGEVVFSQKGFFEGTLSLILSHASPFKQFRNGITGECFDLFSVALLLAFTAFFLILTVQSMNRRRRD